MLSRGAARRRGFTIVEFAVTLAVVAVLLASVMPTASDWVRSLRVRAAAEAIQTGLQQARTEAMRRNTRVSFFLVSLDDPRTMDKSCELSNMSGSWVVSVNDPSGKCDANPSTSADPRIVATHAAGESAQGVVMEAVDAVGDAATTVTFNGFGQVTNGAASVRRVDLNIPDCSDCRTLRVEISPNGAPRTCDPNLSTTGDDPRRCKVVKDN